MSRSFRHGNQQKKKYYGTDYWWWKREPKWWRKIAKHRKRRAFARECRHSVLLGEVDILWPLDKKPWIYYW